MSLFQKLTSEDIDSVDAALDYYHSKIHLPKNRRAFDYLAAQRAISENALNKFNIGFGDRTLFEVISESARGACQRFGFIATKGKSNGREKFRGCVTFPVRDEFGCLTNVYGRKICETLKKTSEAYVVANDDHRCLFNSEAMVEHKTVVLCSSPFEAVSLWSMGVENVTSLLGMRNISDEQILQLQFNDVTNVDVVFSSSPKALRYSYLIEKKLEKSGVSVTRTNLPKHQDINDCVTTLNHLNQAIRNSIHSTLTIGLGAK